MLHVTEALVLLNGPHHSLANMLEEKVDICFKYFDNLQLGDVKIGGHLLEHALLALQAW